MAFKLVLNVLYTVGAVLCLFVAYQQFTAKNYPLVAGALFIGAIVVVLKIKLLKEVKQAQSPKKD